MVRRAFKQPACNALPPSFLILVELRPPLPGLYPVRFWNFLPNIGGDASSAAIFAADTGAARSPANSPSAGSPMRRPRDRYMCFNFGRARLPALP